VKPPSTVSEGEGGRRGVKSGKMAIAVKHYVSAMW